MAHKLHFNFAAFWPRLINQRHVPEWGSKNERV